MVSRHSTPSFGRIATSTSLVRSTNRPIATLRELGHRVDEQAVRPSSRPCRESGSRAARSRRGRCRTRSTKSSMSIGGSPSGPAPAHLVGARRSRTGPGRSRSPCTIRSFGTSSPVGSDTRGTGSRAGVGVELVEPDVERTGGRHETHGHRHEAEADRYRSRSRWAQPTPLVGAWDATTFAGRGAPVHARRHDRRSAAAADQPRQGALPRQRPSPKPPSSTITPGSRRCSSPISRTGR